MCLAAVGPDELLRNTDLCIGSPMKRSTSCRHDTTIERSAEIRFSKENRRLPYLAGIKGLVNRKGFSEGKLQSRQRSSVPSHVILYNSSGL